MAAVIAAFVLLTAPAGDTLKAISAPPLSATASTPFSGVVASFQSDGSAAKMTAQINWGDGGAVDPNTTVAANNSGGFDVSGSHTYAHEGSYAVEVFIQDNSDKSTGTGNTTATVADAPLSATGRSGSATRGLPFNGTVATFTDPDSSASAATFTASIDWGDKSTSAGTVAAADGGGFKVTGSHTYQVTGSQPVTVTIHDSGGASA